MFLDTGTVVFNTTIHVLVSSVTRNRWTLALCILIDLPPERNKTLQTGEKGVGEDEVIELLRLDI